MAYCLIVAVLAYSAVEATNIKAYFPPSSNGNFPRLRLDSTLPKLREFTFCSWVKIHKLDGSHLAPVFSYSTLRDHNEFLVLLFNENGKVTTRVNRGPSVANVDCQYNCQIGVWCHICVSWFGPNGTTNTFVNGNKCKEYFLNFNEPYVPSGGVLVIGQEQDGLDAGYEVNQNWIGDIADLQLWDEVLSVDQIKEVGTCKGKRKVGTVVNWLETPMAASGGLVLSATQLCLP